VIHLYGARGLTHVGAKLDVGEHLETLPWRLDEALAWVRDGIITDTEDSVRAHVVGAVGRQG
jgi:hypothetical protein